MAKIMHLTDTEKRAISSKKTFTDQEKRGRVRELDLEVWNSFATPLAKHDKPTIAYRCLCPYCSLEKPKKNKQSQTHNLTAWVYHHTNGDGLGFYCAACKAKHPRVYDFLGKGSAAAEEYAWKRFEIDAVGKGWYCPYPQRWKEISALNRQRKAAQYKAKDALRKRENQIAYALREKEALKAAKPRTTPGTKGSCSVSKHQAARERKRFASRPARVLKNTENL